MNRHLHIKTFGCQMNERDSEIMVQLLGQHGYQQTPDQFKADLIIINTCAIRAKAEQKVFSLLGSLRKEKAQRPDLRIAVAGCVAQQEAGRIFARMPHVDIVIGTQQLWQLPAMLLRLEQGESSREIACSLDTTFAIPPFQRLMHHTPPAATGDVRKFVTVMQGCSNYCAYCVVPSTRGREISRPAADIIEEAELLVQRGVREITLLGQNVNSYGRANPVAPVPFAFADLLRQIAAVPGLRRLRFTSSNPQDLSEELMHCFRELPILCPHLHLPVQSGSNSILQRMNRKYTRELYQDKVERLRSYCPAIALTTDVIVGFPGESEDDFMQTMSLLDAVRFHGSFSFKYSDRPGTASAHFPDKIDEKVKADRLERFQQRQDEITLERNHELLGKTIEVMIEEVSATGAQARTGSNHVVHLRGITEVCTPGDIRMAKIIRAGQHALHGEAAASVD